MTRLPLQCLERHLFLTDGGGRRWLIDTGAPEGFGEDAIELAGRHFAMPRRRWNTDAAIVSAAVGVRCAGLLGMEVLRCFDWRFDLPAGEVTLSEAPLEVPGVTLALGGALPVPTLEATLDGAPAQLFFDTGAQLSYVRDDVVRGRSSSGRMRDFHAAVGDFETDTWELPVALGEVAWMERWGTLPQTLRHFLGGPLHGILGNSLFSGRQVGFSPRRGELVLGAPAQDTTTRRRCDPRRVTAS